MNIEINWQIIAPELALIAGAFLIFVLDLLLRKRVRHLHLPLALLTLAVSVWLVSTLGWSPQSTVSDSFFVDRTGIFFKFVIYLATFLILLLAEGYRPLAKYPLPELSGLILLWLRRCP